MARYHNVFTVIFTSVLMGCGAQGLDNLVDTGLTGEAAALAAEDGADHACSVVLRDVMRLPGATDYATACEGNVCHYKWTGHVDVSRDAYVSNAEVGVLYRSSGETAWHEVPAPPSQGGRAGYYTHEFEMSAGLFGPDAGQMPPNTRIELVAFLRRGDGTRLFDHNRHAADTANHVLDASNGFALGGDNVCAPIVATVMFNQDWSERVGGTLHAGGWMTLWYDVDRLTSCRSTHNGFPAWDLQAHAYFLPMGEMAVGTVRSFVTVNGRPTNEAVDQPLDVKIPRGATSVEIWFENSSGAGSQCTAWDSNEGANYRFDIMPAVDDVRCLNTERWNSIYGGVESCVRTQPAAQYDATNCEFMVTGFGHGYEGHYGIPVEWLEAWLHVGPQDGEVLNVGMLTRFNDGSVRERFSLGENQGNGTWKTGFTFHTAAPMGPQWSYTVERVAFFIDVRRPSGNVVRLWQSRRGANYSWDDAFGAGVTRQSIPYGNVEWANDGAGIFDSRRACR